LLTGHKGAVLDLAFSPFNNNLLATSSEDASIKLWNLPDGGFDGHKTDFVQSLSGHNKKVGAIMFHPLANNIFSSSSQDNTVRIWDIENGKEMYKVGGPTNIIQSIDWNYDGSLICSNSKDKNVRLIDIRAQKEIASGESHVGVKGGRALFMGKHAYIASIGFGKGASREYKLFDQRKIDAGPICQSSIDNAAGVIMPFYDEDSDLLFLAGKGDGAIRYYEILVEEEPAKMVSQCGSFSSNNPTAAACSLPRRYCDISQTEIIRIYKFSKGVCYPLQFCVPRRSAELFADDIYPPCRGDEPAISKADWFAGKSATPKLVSLEGGFVSSATNDVGNFQINTSAAAITTDGPVDYKAKCEELERRVADLEEEIRKRDERIASLEGS